MNAVGPNMDDRDAYTSETVVLDDGTETMKIAADGEDNFGEYIISDTYVIADEDGEGIR